DYQCLQGGVKRYYEGKHLRGMRIDSIVVEGSDLVYYPFRSCRGNINSLFPVLDTNGGSWLGKRVVLKADGSTLFDNLWGDTVVIKSQANVGESWIFYD